MMAARLDPYAGLLVTLYRPWSNAAGTVLGDLEVELASGMRIAGLKLMLGPNGLRWVSMPGVKLTDPDGRAMVNAAGKQVWRQFVLFRDRRCGDRFQAAVLAALAAQHPDALGDSHSHEQTSSETRAPFALENPVNN